MSRTLSDAAGSAELAVARPLTLRRVARTHQHSLRRPRPGTSASRLPRSSPARTRPGSGLLTRGPITLGFLGVLGVGAGLAVLQAATSITSVLVYAGVAYFLALVLEPFVRFVGRRGGSRGRAVLTLVVLLLVVLAALLLVVTPIIAEQATRLATTIPAALKALISQPWAAGIADQLGLDDLVKSITSYLADPARLSSLAGGLLSVGSGVVSGAEAVIVVLVLTIYFTLALPQITDWIFQLVPASRATRARAVYDEMALVVGRYVSSQLLIAGINAVLTLILLLILQVPAAFLLAVLAFVAALIPVVGTIAAGVLIIIVAFFTSPVAGFVVLGYYVLYHPFEGYVLGPRLTSHAVSVSGYAVLIAVVAGSALGGILGALVAVPLTAAAGILISRVVVPRQASR